MKEAKQAANLPEDLEMDMVSLIEKLAGDKAFDTFPKLQQELLRRVNFKSFGDDVFKGSAAQAAEYASSENSVFDRVEQHKLNGEHKMDLFAEQFSQVHDGKDHKTFTEEWLLKETGEEVQLEKVLENPSFADFTGVYDVVPRTAYVASKLIIDESDFMGLFDLAGSGTQPLKHTYEGVTSDGVSEQARHTMTSEAELLAEAKVKGREAAEAEIAQRKPAATAAAPTQSRGLAHVPCCCASADGSVKPHALGDGQYLQFRLRQGNVVKYLANTFVAKKLKNLIPDDPMEPIYIFTASANGIVRFFPWGGIERKLWHAYGDSETTPAFEKNIAHSVQYGCFCFGVIYKERENYKDRSGKLKKGGRTFVMRYNRWATDNAPIYCMRRQRPDEQDASVPKQVGMIEYYKNRFIDEIESVVGKDLDHDGKVAGEYK